LIEGGIEYCVLGIETGLEKIGMINLDYCKHTQYSILKNMPYKETETVKLYYSIGEVAKMFDVNASLLRFWEKEFDIIKPKKNKKGDRMFTQEDVSNFRTIFHLVKERGYTLQGAKEKLKATKKEETFNNVEMVKSLEKVKGFLLELKSAL
jgi:DNA-binding transcriptional MerR regulator